MSWMDKLERKWGRYAIPNITRYFVYASLIGLILNYAGDIIYSRIGINLSGLLAFDAYSILHLQLWRLVTWIFSSPGGSLLSVIFLLCLLSMGNSLESIVGSFRMNVYMIGGVIISDIGGLLVYGISRVVLSFLGQSGSIPVYLSSYYILISIFMALAMCMPEGTVMLYFVLPIKMKWMLIIYFLELGYELVTYFRLGYQSAGLPGAIVYVIMFGSQIIFALLNFVLFFWGIKPKISRAQKKRQREFQSQAAPFRPDNGMPRHKCAICGRTEKDDPSLVFRYCSKCAGNREYCQEHLFTHQHVQ